MGEYKQRAVRKKGDNPVAKWGVLTKSSQNWGVTNAISWKWWKLAIGY